MTLPGMIIITARNTREGKFDTIFCVYVLNVLEPYAQAEVMMNVSNLFRQMELPFCRSA